MKVLLLSDTHGSHAALERVRNVHEKTDVALVCISGDFTSGGSYQQPLFGFIRDAGTPCAFVSGNCESRAPCEKAAAEYGFHYLDYRAEAIGDVLVAGVAGFDLLSPERGPNIARFARAGLDFEASGFSVLLSHEPPFPWRYRGREAGSREVTSFLEGKPFNLVASGHLHEKAPRREEGPFGIPVLNPGTKGCLIEVGPGRADFKIVG